MMRDPDRGWNADARPARGYEVPGQMPRDVGHALGLGALDGRVCELVERGWRVDATSDGRVQLSRPSYWLPVPATALLIFVTFGLWIVPVVWLQGSRRRDECLLVLVPGSRLIETRTRGW